MFAIVQKQDGSGKIAIEIDAINTIEEITGANTATTYSIITLNTGKTISVKDNFNEFMKVIHYDHLAHFEPEDQEGVI